MKKLIEDIKSENYTRDEIVIYGIIAPLALVLVCVVAGWLCNQL